MPLINSRDCSHFYKLLLANSQILTHILVPDPEGEVTERNPTRAIPCLILYPQLVKAGLRLRHDPEGGSGLNKSHKGSLCYFLFGFPKDQDYLLTVGDPEEGSVLNKSTTKLRFVLFCFLQLLKASFQRCLKTKKPDKIVWLLLVGVAGFEPAASCSQSRRDNRATLHPVNSKAVFTFNLRRDRDSNPGNGYPLTD